jgi:hypothetical protein
MSRAKYAKQQYVCSRPTSCCNKARSGSFSFFKISFLIFLFILIFIAEGFSQRIYQDRSDTVCGMVWGPIWQLSSDGSDHVSLPTIAVSDNVVHITWESDSKFNLPYIRSTDGGATWDSVIELMNDTILFPPRTKAAFPFVKVNRDNVYIIFATSLINGHEVPPFVYKSIDGGVSWLPAYPLTNDTTGPPYSVAQHHDTLALTAFKKGEQYPRPSRLWVSTDSGRVWTRQQKEFVTTAKVALSSGTVHIVDDASAAPTIREIIYRRSFDLGNSWSDSVILSYNDGMTSLDPRISSNLVTKNMYVVWREPRLGGTSLIDVSISLRQSYDNGTSFLPETVLTTIPTGSGPAVAGSGSMVIVAWLDNNYPLVNANTIHARVSLDGGESWCLEYNLNPEIYISQSPSVAASNNAVHVVWPQGTGELPNQKIRIFYRRATLLPADVQKTGEFSRSISLSQNYPNPFNPKTKIGFRLQVAGFTTLKVYDMFGREIATLVNEKLQAGEHAVEWNAEKFSSGIYFYRITTENSIETRKAVLIK